MGIKRKKVTKTTKKLITMKGTRKLHSVAQFSLIAPDIRKNVREEVVLSWVNIASDGLMLISKS